MEYLKTDVDIVMKFQAILTLLVGELFNNTELIHGVIKQYLATGKNKASLIACFHLLINACEDVAAAQRAISGDTHGKELAEYLKGLKARFEAYDVAKAEIEKQTATIH